MRGAPWRRSPTSPKTPMSKVGAKAKGAGKKPAPQGRVGADGATDTKLCAVTLDAGTIKKAKKLGDGNLSLGIRKAVRAA